ncbi:sensor histidine kinase [Tindallia californiensis]|nr:ATP-binding protein [Tindallia californiensis]
MTITFGSALIPMTIKIKRKQWPLHMILIGSFLLVMISIVSAFILLINHHYQFLYEEKGRQLTHAFNRHVHAEIENLLTEPMLFNQFFRSHLQEEFLFQHADLSSIETLQQSLFQEYVPYIPQVSVLSYGDEQGRYAGIRRNQDGTTNIMIKDQRTKDALVIFEGNQITSRQRLVMEDYDLHLRPFYQPLQDHPVPSWSSLYVNQDERMEVTVTHMLPFFDTEAQFAGVSAVDVSLYGLQEHLRKDEILRSGGGVIYVVDHQWNLVAHSGQEPWIHVKDETGELIFEKATTINHPLINHSAKHMIHQEVRAGEAFSVAHPTTPYYAIYAPLTDKHLPPWQVIVALPEESLMGAVKEQQHHTLYLVLGLILLVTGLSLWFLKRIVTPIQQTSKAAKKIAAGHWNVDLPATRSIVTETHQLLTSFQQMMVSLQQSFEKLENSKQQYQDLFNDKSEELKRAMSELIDREKLASLGGLVAGVSHEINTPLGTSISSVSYISHQTEKVLRQLEDSRLTEEGLYGYFHDLQESLKLLENNLERSAHLVNSFKEIAVNQNIESPQSFQLKTLINNVILSLRHEYKHQQHQFQVDCPEDLWIHSYPGVYSQILTNLVMNSIIHGLSDHSSGLITIKAAIKHGTLQIVYGDNGSGLTEEVKKNIFEPFFTTKRGKGSSGLGMSIVHNLVTQKLKGSIRCNGQVSQGVLFHIEAPVQHT